MEIFFQREIYLYICYFMCVLTASVTGEWDIILNKYLRVWPVHEFHLIIHQYDA